MKTLYFDCGSGAAGDMITAALVELFDDRQAVAIELNDLGIPGVTFAAEPSVKNGITGTNMRVFVGSEEEGCEVHDHGNHPHTHEHSGMQRIEHIVRDHINASDSVKEHVLAVYKIIAEAESKVHNVEIKDIHFHEVGTMDAIADITAACYLFDKIGASQILASPIHVGRGVVKCAHGLLPVPAPATALILNGVPIYSREEVEGELCTPTGAAILKHFVSNFIYMPMMTVEKIGYGMGKKNFATTNSLRVFLGDTQEE